MGARFPLGAQCAGRQLLTTWKRYLRYKPTRAGICATRRAGSRGGIIDCMVRWHASSCIGPRPFRLSLTKYSQSLPSSGKSFVLYPFMQLYFFRSNMYFNYLAD